MDDADDVRDNDDGDWDNMEEKEWEEDDDDDDDVVDITAVQLFGVTDEAFLGKDTESKKKEDEEKSKGNVDDSVKNSGGGAKRGKKMKGGIYGSASKVDNKDNADSWDKHDFDVGGGSDW